MVGGRTGRWPVLFFSTGCSPADLPEAPAEGIPHSQLERRLAVDVRRARDDGFDLALGPVPPAKASGEGAAKDAFWDLVLTFGQLSVGGPADELRNRPGAARRTAVRARVKTPLLPGITPVGEA